MILHNFIVLEGGDGTGTSTQLSQLQQLLRIKGNGVQIYYSFEPTDGPIGTLIRSALRNSQELQPETIARLFAADRGEHLFGTDGIVDHCKRGELVVCDRYVPSSLVYQGIQCGMELPSRLNADFPYPELIFYFDISPDTAAERYGKRVHKDSFEQLDFQVEVHRRYNKILPEYCERGGTRLVRIDAGLPIEEVTKQLWSELEKLPIFSR